MSGTEGIRAFLDGDELFQKRGNVLGAERFQTGECQYNFGQSFLRSWYKQLQRITV